MTHIEDISEHLRFRPAVEEDYPAIGALVTSQEELFFRLPQRALSVGCGANTNIGS